MDYKETRLMTDDYLKTVKLLCWGIFQTKIGKLILMLLLIVHGGITLIEIYFIFFVFNIKEFVSYGPVFFTMLYGVLEIITIPIYSKFMGDISGDITMWAFESAGSETYSKIKKDIKIVTICAVANFALAFVAGCFYVQYLPKESELFWAYKLFEDHFSSQSPALTIIYKLTIPLMGYVMVVHAIQSIYYTQHMKFQMNMLHKHVKHLTDYENDRISEEMYYDEEYQTEICRRLRYCIERHINLVNLGNAKLEEMNHLIVIFSLSGCLVGISIVIILFSGESFEEHYVRLGVTSVAVTVTFVGIFISGQGFEDEANNLALVVSEINWYTLNSKNKKRYVIFLINAMKPFRIQFSDEYVLNYQLGLTIVRAVYAVVSVMIDM